MYWFYSYWNKNFEHPDLRSAQVTKIKLYNSRVNTYDPKVTIRFLMAWMVLNLKIKTVLILWFYPRLFLNKFNSCIESERILLLKTIICVYENNNNFQRVSSERVGALSFSCFTGRIFFYHCRWRQMNWFCYNYNENITAEENLWNLFGISFWEYCYENFFLVGDITGKRHQCPLVRKRSHDISVQKPKKSLLF